MGSKRPETMAKRARELAVREKRELKKQKKQAAALAKLEPAIEYGTHDVPQEAAADDVSDDVAQTG